MCIRDSFYPRQFLASQVLGSVGTDGSGLMGLEYRNDHALEGSSGRRRLVKDALGQSIEVRDTKPAKPGVKMELTIDAAIQDKVERVLADLGATYRPHGATAIVMNPATGEYSKFHYIASFMGFAPAINPKLLIGVMVDEPQGAIYGGVVAAPAFGKIASFALPYMRIPPQ